MKIKIKIINAIATIASDDVIVLNWTDGKVYNYTKDYLLETSFEYIETSIENEKLLEKAIDRKEFLDFVVTTILEHKTSSAEYMPVQGYVENEVALTCN